MFDIEKRNKENTAIIDNPLLADIVSRFLIKRGITNGYIEGVVRSRDTDKTNIYSLVNDMFIDRDLIPPSEVVLKAEELIKIDSNNKNDGIAKRMIHWILLQATMREITKEKEDAPVRALDEMEYIADLNMSEYSFCRVKIFLEAQDEDTTLDVLEHDIENLAEEYAYNAQRLDNEFFKPEVSIGEFKNNTDHCVILDIADDHEYWVIEEFTHEILPFFLEDNYKRNWRVEEINPIDGYIRKFAHNVTIGEEMGDWCEESKESCEYKCENECRKNLIPKPAEIINLNPVVVLEKTNMKSEEMDESDIARFEFNKGKQAEILTSVKSQRTYVLESKEYDDEQLEIINLIHDYDLGHIIYL